MKIALDDQYIILYFEDPQEEILITKRFTYEDNSYVFTGGTFNANMIRRRSFLRTQKKLKFLYSGFLKEFLLFIKENKFKVSELLDKRTKFDHYKKEFSDEEIRPLFPEFKYIDHQLSSIKHLLKTSYGIIEAPTSSGKSETMIAYVKLAKLPALILVNRISLAIQLRDRLVKNGIKNAGLCYGQSFINGDVVVSTIGSVKKIPDIHKFKVLIVDEVHRAQSKQFQEFLIKTLFPIRFGFSATPNAGDPYKWALIRQFFGDIIYSIEPKELVEHEVIALPNIEFIDVQCPPTIDWPSANINCIVENTDRNKKIKELVDQYNTQTLILINNIEHGQILNQLIPDSVFLSGIDDPLYRKDVIYQFENGDINTIISTKIFNEGISINAIRLLLIAGGGKSKIETIQRLGRGLRTMPGKTEVKVIDFYDEGNYFTERHSKIRKKIYIKTGFEVKSS